MLSGTQATSFLPLTLQNIDLIETTFSQQTDFLKEKLLIPAFANQDTRVLLLQDKATKQYLAAALINHAEKSILAEHHPSKPSALQHAILIHALWQAENCNGFLPLILYLALRRGRIDGRKTALFLTENKGESSVLQFIHAEQLSSLSFASYQASAQIINYAMHLLYRQINQEQKDFIKYYFGLEAVETVQNWLREFFNNAWTQAVLKGTMSKQQYIATLFSLHTYVRYTTRLIARAIAHAEDITLRNHYISHLKGEINHEKIIERDLQTLGADLDYLMNYYVPNVPTKEFMVVQESTIGFYQNPVLLLACPLAAEGITAAITSDFLDALYKLIEQWGIKEPLEAARFISSHTHTDGGEDGHWQGVITMMQRFIESEPQMQQFLGVLGVAMEGLERSFVSNIKDWEIWS